MVGLIQSEFIKGRRSFSRKSLILFPVLITAMATVLMGGRFTQVGAFNWWCVMLLPAVLAVTCTQLVGPEKKYQYVNMSVVSTGKASVWYAKVFAGCSYLFAANLLVFLLTNVTGALFSAQYPVWRGLAACLALTVAFAWQIPLGMLLTAKLGSAFTLMGMLIVNVLFSIQDFAGRDFWFIPFSIPARLLSPIIWVNPNGVPLEPGSPLYDTGVILPGLLITAVLFAVSLLITGKWFERREG